MVGVHKYASSCEIDARANLYEDTLVFNYLDTSIVTNGHSQLEAGAWSHPYKRMERISGVVANLGRANPLQTMVDLRRARQQVQYYTGKVGDAKYPAGFSKVE
ncbi:hypothetical protein LWI29_025081 [Acer saccharum]|uniref:Uncharacterized protein n=1 Tax=Acer saccharum TaxID=4024 RepID=A0AA39W3L7_ACESA|nr:hypothetical protein LWI29_025081 [Acer saccharum]